MDPILIHNALWCLATLIYVKVIVTACDAALNAMLLPADVSRKIIHIAACSWCLFWPQFDTSHWSWKLNVAIPAVYSIQLFVKGAIVRDATDPDVKTMSRTGHPSELLYGPFLFTIVMLFCGLHEFMQPAGVCIMGALLGDGLAPLLGKRYPIIKYPTLGGSTKSLAGSLTMFGGCALGISTYAYLLDVPQHSLDVESILMISLVATLAEAVTGIWDNPAIAMAVYWFYKATDLQIQI